MVDLGKSDWLRVGVWATVILLVSYTWIVGHYYSTRWKAARAKLVDPAVPNIG